jgi:hypothetical protein
MWRWLTNRATAGTPQRGRGLAGKTAPEETKRHTKFRHAERVMNHLFPLGLMERYRYNEWGGEKVWWVVKKKCE